MNSNVAHIVYAADDMFAEILGVSLVSLYENSQDMEDIVVYVLDMIITFPYLLKCIRGKDTRRIVKWGVIIIFTVYMFYDICILGDHDVLPYQWIFGKTATPFSGWK